MSNSINHSSYDVAIIGAGPAGLAAATALKNGGIKRVIVLDREESGGGIPRHCGHPPFGLWQYKRVLTGPSYAKKIVAAAQQAGVSIALNTTVTNLGVAGLLTLVSPEGTQIIKAKRVILATGTRETPRSARMISGNRLPGICNTGTLQSMVYLKKMIPFHRPVVVGTEIVSFSALLTCRNAGIKPVAMLEENLQPTVKWPIHWAARLFSVPLFLGVQNINIFGKNRVEAVSYSDKSGKNCEIPCDGILFTGQFTPESSLARMGNLTLNPITGSPVVDQFGRCSDPSYYAAGNVLQHPVEIAGKCWQKGSATAQWIIKDLAGELSSPS